LLGLELASVHNLQFYLWLMQEIRDRLENDTFDEWYLPMAKQLDQRL
jgi:queuine tRNA-ribosyltransferase